MAAKRKTKAPDRPKVVPPDPSVLAAWAKTPNALAIKRSLLFARAWGIVEQLEAASDAPPKEREQAAFVARAALAFLERYPLVESVHAPRITRPQVSEAYAILVGRTETAIRAIDAMLDVEVTDDQRRTLFEFYSGKPPPEAWAAILDEYRSPKWRNGRPRDHAGARLRAVGRLVCEAKALGFGQSNDPKRKKKDRDRIRAALLTEK